MDGINMKEVYFENFCDTCVHHEKPEDEEPCDECLAIPARLYSHRPEFYEVDVNAKRE